MYTHVGAWTTPEEGVPVRSEPGSCLGGERVGGGVGGGSKGQRAAAVCNRCVWGGMLVVPN